MRERQFLGKGFSSPAGNKALLTSEVRTFKELDIILSNRVVADSPLLLRTFSISLRKSNGSTQEKHYMILKQVLTEPQKLRNYCYEVAIRYWVTLHIHPHTYRSRPGRLSNKQAGHGQHISS